MYHFHNINPSSDSGDENFGKTISGPSFSIYAHEAIQNVRRPRRKSKWRFYRGRPGQFAWPWCFLFNNMLLPRGPAEKWASQPGQESRWHLVPPFVCFELFTSSKAYLDSWSSAVTRLNDSPPTSTPIPAPIDTFHVRLNNLSDIIPGFFETRHLRASELYKYHPDHPPFSRGGGGISGAKLYFRIGSGPFFRDACNFATKCWRTFCSANIAGK